ncbi:MAG: hypothetical protein GTN78_19950 [Gemmatimonadales bacterium]|nr:hypothetical protein [Gemmatimonadales bacterium]NIN12648.1 hypothetical protein [Gemmatimonadales bacterium]NIR02441.1 hypothetical protein [Gemmatimonadales bacterium]NIS66232.1 hypothetical protein [Gemmatimonadales bacterium]
MRSSRRRALVALAALGVAAFTQEAAAQSWRTISSARQLQGEQQLTVDVEFASGTFRLQPAAGTALYRAELMYDADYFEPRGKYDAATHTLKIGVTIDRGTHNLDLSDDSPQYLNLAISPDVPAALKLQFGLARAEIDLGGLSVAGASVKTGASESWIGFSRPNRINCRSFEIAVGAAELLVEGLGNARCRRIRAIGGAGDLTLDFTGDWHAEVTTRGDIKLGFGTLTLRFPKELGVELDIDRLLASFDQRGFVKRGSRYVSTNYDSTRARLRLNIDAAIGEIHVEWVN